MSIFTEQIRLLIDADTKGAVQPMDHLAKQSKKTETAFDRMAKSMGVSASTLKAGLVAGAGALVGTGLVVGLRNVVTGFADAAKASGDLAESVGGNVETVSRMQAALKDAGVSAEQSAGMLTKFTTVASSKKGADALAALNVELVKGKDGAVDYAATMVAAVDAIGQIGDASERSRQFVALFGKQGAQAFQDLIASGQSLESAMASVRAGRVITDADLANARKFDDAMDAASASAEELGNSVGRVLLPMLVGLAGVIQPVVDAVGLLPPEFILVAAGAVALNKALTSTLVTGAFAGIRAAVPVIIGSLTSITGAFTAAGLGIQAAGTMIAANPIGLLLTAAAVGLTTGMIAMRQFNEEAAEAATQLNLMKAAGQDADKSLEQLALEAERTDSTLAGVGASMEGKDTFGKLRSGLTGLVGLFGLLHDAATEGGDSQEAYAERIKKIAEEQGIAAAKAEQAATAQKTLNDLIASGVTSGPQFVEAVTDTAEAMAEQERNTLIAKTAIDKYRESTDLAYDSVVKLLGIGRGEESAQRGTAAAIDAVADARARLRETEKKAKEDGVTDAEQREINDALRGYEDALDGVSTSFQALAQARIDAALVKNPFLSDVEQLGILRDTLAEGLKAPGLSKASKAELRADLDTVEAKLKSLGGAPIEIDGVKFKEGTTQKQVDALQTKIKNAMLAGDYGLAGKLNDELKGMQWQGVAPVPTTIVGPDGKPLGDSTINVGVETAGLDQAKSDLEALATDRTVDVTYAVTGLDQVNRYNDDLDGKQLELTAVYDVEGLDQVNRYNDDLDGKRLDITVEYLVRGLDDVNRYNDDLDGKVLDIGVRYHRIKRSPQGGNSLPCLDTAAPSSSTRAAGPTSLVQHFTFNINGAGAPQATVAEIERYLRKAGDPSKVTVSAP